MKRLLLAALLGLTACAPDATQPMMQAGTTSTARFDVQQVGIVADDLAYNSRRGLYVIVDRKTGQEYVGLSGVGIAEIGSHSCGKGCTAEDER